MPVRRIIAQTGVGVFPGRPRAHDYLFLALVTQQLYLCLSLTVSLTPSIRRRELFDACSTQHFRGRPGCLLHVPNCSEPCRDVTEM